MPCACPHPHLSPLAAAERPPAQKYSSTSNASKLFVLSPLMNEYDQTKPPSIDSSIDSIQRSWKPWSGAREHLLAIHSIKAGRPGEQSCLRHETAQHPRGQRRPLLETSTCACPSCTPSLAFEAKTRITRYQSACS